MAEASGVLHCTALVGLSGELLTLIFGLSDRCTAIGMISMTCTHWRRLANVECLHRKFGFAIQVRRYTGGLITPTTLASRHTAAINALAIGPGRLLASGSDDKSICVGGAGCLQPLSLVSPDYDHGFSAEVYAVVFNSSGSVLYAGSSDSHDVQVWDPASGKLNRLLEGHSAYISALAINAADELFSGSADHQIRRWSAPTLQFPHFHSTAVTELVCVTESSLLCSAAANDTKIGVWSFEGTLVNWLKSPDWSVPAVGELVRINMQFTCLAVGSLSRLYAGRADGQIVFWSELSRQESRTPTIKSSGAISMNKPVRYHGNDPVPYRGVSGFLSCRVASSLAVAPGGQRLVVGCRDGMLRVLDISEVHELRVVAEVHELSDHEKAISAVLIRRDHGRDTIYTASLDGTIKIW